MMRFCKKNSYLDLFKYKITLFITKIQKLKKNYKY